MTDFLHNYFFVWSESEKKLHREIAGLSDFQIQRDFELENFYDLMESSFPTIESFEMQFGSSFEEDSKLIIHYMDPKEQSFDVGYTYTSYGYAIPYQGQSNPAKKTLVIYGAEYQRNKRLCKIFLNWAHAQTNIMSPMHSKDSMKYQVLNMFGFEESEI